MPETVVIAGAGQAAAQAIITLRHGGFTGGLVLVGEERYFPYHRPPLSKKFLAGEMEIERLHLRPDHFYAENHVDVRLATRVEQINRAAKTVRLSTGGEVHYDRLILATGGHVRRVPVPGEDLAGVHYLRNIDDVRRIRAGFQPDRRLVVVGGGYIGLEVAAVAVTAGLAVTVVEIADRLMARVVAPPISEFYLRAHREAGVDFRLGAGANAFRRASSGLNVVCTTGAEVPADLVVIGVGILPATQLAEEAGLECSNGIIVDEFCRTGDPDIFAAGDCTNHPNSLLGRRLRLESVHNAQEQGKTAALAILGMPEAYAQIPWFWSDQYDLKLQMTGLAEQYTSLVIRGDPESRSFAAFHFAGDRLIAVHAVNSPREFMLSKKLIAHGAQLDPSAVGDVTIPFKELAEAARITSA